MKLAPLRRSRDAFPGVAGVARLDRRTKRLVTLATQVAGDPSSSLPKQTQDWSDLKAAYRLLDRPEATFEVIAPTIAGIKANDASIIDLDRTTGYIKPLQVGEALVKTSFAGWTNLMCVLVESERNPDEGPTPTCESLLLPGEKLATPTRQ